MARPSWLSGDVASLKVYVFKSPEFRARGTTPDTKEEFYQYSLCPRTHDGDELIGAYRLNELNWY